MSRLHIGYFNVAMLDQIVQRIENQEGIVDTTGGALTSLVATWFDGPISRVDPLCDQILESPYDVICLSEVWDHDSRDQFIKRLSEQGPYKYYTKPLGGVPLATGAGAAAAALGAIILNTVVASVVLPIVADRLVQTMNSSGLLVFSRYPFVPIKDIGTCAFVQYSDGASFDRFAPKGGGVVVIQHPVYRYVMVGFTHLQADYAHDAHPDVRAKQIQQWWRLMQDVGKKMSISFVVAGGDLNIDGNPANKAAEYHDIFQSTHPFSTFLKDQWLETHHPQDLMLTHPGDAQRLDYVLVGAGNPAVPNGTPAVSVSTHQLMLARNLLVYPTAATTPFAEPAIGLPARAGTASASDHFGVNAVINFQGPHCTPRLAQPVVFQLADNAITVPFSLSGRGDYLWLRFDFEGTVFVKVDGGAGAEILVFAPTDLSTGIAAIEPAGWTAADQRLYGSRFSLPSPPAFVRLRQLAVAQQNPLQGTLKIAKAGGQSKKLAVCLDGWRRYKRLFGKVMNPEDSLWFEIHPNQPDSGASQLIQIKVAWNTALALPATPFELSLEDNTGKVLGKTLCQTPTGSVLKVVVSKPATAEKPWSLFPRLKRLSNKVPPTPIAFSIEWTSNVTILHGPTYMDRQVPGNPGPLELEATDETGSDWLGSDEPQLRATIDGSLVRKQTYQNVDSGTKVAVDQIAPINYQTGVAVYLEEDKDEKTTQTLLPLQPNEPPKFGGQPLHLDIGSGNYELRYNLSHWLETSPPPKQQN